ncbi:hypothetical protein DhcVS_1350 [Dehalococcoides mccartyi VS]|uniref:Uncharacterized protein n=1 Tax=Dehalococcoides mccartyi (strain VS) TaxID=311424 RepID=D2BJE9_DEHMV|nr:hypothetical protein DhcVS_1350 [Dehalococcoides mccartyi VS]
MGRATNVLADSKNAFTRLLSQYISTFRMCQYINEHVTFLTHACACLRLWAICIKIIHTCLDNTLG